MHLVDYQWMGRGLSELVCHNWKTADENTRPQEEHSADQTVKACSGVAENVMKLLCLCLLVVMPLKAGKRGNVFHELGRRIEGLMGRAEC